jgi:hypothetical protein
MKRWHSMKCPGMWCGLVWVLVLFLFAGCNGVPGKDGFKAKSDMTFTTDYQAVFLDNGQAFFGKLENADSAYPLLKEVFYIQRQVNPNNKDEVKNILIKRGSEWHGPDKMYINSAHIVLIEPVAAGSQVANLIKEAQAKQPGGAQ